MIPLLTFKGRRGGSDLRRSQFLIVNVRQHQHRKARAGTPLRAFFSLRQIIWAELVGTTFFLLVGVSYLSGRRRAAPRTGGLRVFRMGVPAVAEGRIAETFAADTGR